MRTDHSICSNPDASQKEEPHFLSFTDSSVAKDLHSAKGGAVETGCSELYNVIYYFTM